jgi:dTDP-4-dehydrorhamnose reductase
MKNIYKIEDQEHLKNISNKKFLITGCAGMLGNSFLNQIKIHLKNPTIYCFNKLELDVSRANSFNKYIDLKPDFIIHCAALVNADLCEKNKNEGRSNIVNGTKNIMNFAEINNSKVFYPQSFLIYNDTNDIVDENTVPKPLSEYGNLKLESENILLDQSNNSISVRMGGFFGGEEKDNNFVGKITSHISKLIKQGKQNMEIGDRVWQPSFTDDLAYNSLILLANNKSGKYNMASHGSCSFFELTNEILKILNINDKFNVNCISAKILGGREIAKRPLSVIMNNNRLKQENLDRQRNWKSSLKEYLEKPYFKNLFI